MLGKGWEIYKATRKKHDLVFNVYLMRPIAAQLVALLAPTGVTPNQITIINLFMFIVAGAALIALPTWAGGLVGIGVLEASYCLDCVDGMLARHKKIASKEGHLFDFFTDELKAVLLAAALGIRLWRSGGLGLDGRTWEAGSPYFLLAGIAGAVTLASAVSLTNFVRHPALSGKETTVEAHYETNVEKKATSIVGRVAQLVTAFLRFLNHYPSHLWIFALLGRLDVFFWIYVGINLLYLARGWLGIILRFGRGTTAR
ncbi:MAG TPA: CDP-alcohol phosphatidyltransferase family protein [Labilithrix sp.]|nr:CDP-alcohol phosphatidyltransferase family protein [Labilithrix sp.]